MIFEHLHYLPTLLLNLLQQTFDGVRQLVFHYFALIDVLLHHSDVLLCLEQLLKVGLPFVVLGIFVFLHFLKVVADLVLHFAFSHLHQEVRPALVVHQDRREKQVKLGLHHVIIHGF